MANQVNFKTSTQAAYNGLGTKDVNTFYKTDDGHLYLGTHRLDNMGLTGYTNTNLNRAVNLSGDKGYITLPTPVTRTDSTATDLPLAASVGKSLQDQINSLNANYNTLNNSFKYNVNNYSSILAWANNQTKCSVCYGIFSGAPLGIDSDAPTSGCEWLCVLFGLEARRIVLAFHYSNTQLYLRNIFQGNWLGGWTQIH